MDTINIKEILRKHGVSDRGVGTENAIKEIVEAVVDKCAEKGEVENLMMPNCDDHTPYRGACVSCGRYDNPDVLVGSRIEKQSILNVKTMINYE